MKKSVSLHTLRFLDDDFQTVGGGEDDGMIFEVDGLQFKNKKIFLNKFSEISNQMEGMVVIHTTHYPARKLN